MNCVTVSRLLLMNNTMLRTERRPYHEGLRRTVGADIIPKFKSDYVKKNSNLEVDRTRSLGHDNDNVALLRRRTKPRSVAADADRACHPDRPH